jgi:hypothetical protein
VAIIVAKMAYKSQDGLGTLTLYLLEFCIFRLQNQTLWQVGFLVWSLVLCLVVRFLGVYLLTFFVNRYRIKPINLQVHGAHTGKNMRDLGVYFLTFFVNR